MRDMHRMRERAGVQIERSQLVTWSLGLVVLLAGVFSVGYVVGKRTTALQPESDPAPIAAIDHAQQRHTELTFYSKLSDQEPQRAAKVKAPDLSPPLSVETAVERVRKMVATEVAAPGVPVALPAAEIPSAMAGITVSESGIDEGPALGGDYTVQVSAFRTRAEADAYAASLGRRGYKPFVVESAMPDKGTWFRVRLGRFTDESDAVRAKEELAAAAIPAWVLRAER